MSPRGGGGVAVGYGAGTGGGGGGGGSEPQGVLFHSDWSTATGTSDAALRDTDKANPWDESDTPGLEVVGTGISLGFPTANVLRVYGGGGIDNASRIRIAPDVASPIIPAFNVGDHQYIRYYEKYQLPIDDDGSYQPVDDDRQWHPNETHGGTGETGGSQANWSHYFEDYDPVAETFTTSTHTNGAAFPNDAWSPGSWLNSIDANEVWRWEFHNHRVSSTAFHHECRLYNAADTLVYSESQWLNKQNNQSTADGIDIGPNSPWDHFQGWQMGLNGWPGAPATEMTFAYIGAVAISDSDWLGPYSGGI